MPTTRPHLQRTVLLLLAIFGWVFLFLSLGSFHPTDWPSHAVYPYQPTQNLCGSAGALAAYWFFVVIGQGVYPLLFFTGVCLAAVLLRNPVHDLGLRAAGLAILCISVAAFAHHFSPGSAGSLPEGQGGFIGISTAALLQQQFGVVGTRLVLLAAFIVGLLLAADDLVFNAPALVSAAAATVRAGAESRRRMTWATAAQFPLNFAKGLLSGISSGAKLLKPSPSKRRRRQGTGRITSCRRGIALPTPNTATPPRRKNSSASRPRCWSRPCGVQHRGARRRDRHRAGHHDVRDFARAGDQSLGDHRTLQRHHARAQSRSVRIVAPVPGKNTVGIEVPNAQKEKVRLKELMQPPRCDEQDVHPAVSSARTPAASR
jgi:hypothetical protein